MATNAKKIAAWRKSNPDDRLTAKTLREVLGVKDFRGMDFRDVDFQDADLQDADLRGADFRGADFRGADFRYADLRNANFRNVNFWEADIQGADLWSGLRVDGLRSGQATMVPTPDGWALRVGCWTGTVDDLRTMISTDEDWPEAEGAECARRRPQLMALITLCEAHMAMYDYLIPELAERWGTTKEEN